MCRHQTNKGGEKNESTADKKELLITVLAAFILLMPLRVSACADFNTSYENWWDTYNETFAKLTGTSEENVIEIVANPTVEITIEQPTIPAENETVTSETPIIEIVAESTVEATIEQHTIPAEDETTISTPVIQFVNESVEIAETSVVASTSEPVIITPEAPSAPAVEVSTNITPIADPTTIVDNEQVLDMARVIYMESRGEPLEGKIAVGAVVMNRYKSGRFGSSISSVCKAPGQFAKIGGVSDKMLQANPECLVAAQRALSGEDPTAGMLYFNSDKNSMKTHRADRFYIGGHQFYGNMSA